MSSKYQQQYDRRSPLPSQSRQQRDLTPSPPSRPRGDYDRKGSPPRRNYSPSYDGRHFSPQNRGHKDSPLRRQYTPPPHRRGFYSPTGPRYNNSPGQYNQSPDEIDGFHDPFSNRNINSRGNFHSSTRGHGGRYHQQEPKQETEFRSNYTQNRGGSRGRGRGRRGRRRNIQKINTQTQKNSTPEFIFPKIMPNDNKNWKPLNYDSLNKLCEIAKNTELSKTVNAQKQGDGYLANVKHCYEVGDMETCFLNALLYMKLCEDSTIPNNATEQAFDFVNALHPMLQKRYDAKEEETVGAAALKPSAAPSWLQTVTNMFTGLNFKTKEAVTIETTDTDDDDSESEKEDENKIIGYLGTWREESNGECTRAVVGGHNKDDEEIYVARLIHNRDVLPGKLLPYKSKCYSSAKGEEVFDNEYEILCKEKGKKTEWIDWDSSKKYIKDTAIIGGISNGNPLYIGRIKHGKSITCGKVDSKTRKLYVVYMGKEHPYDAYELLVVKNKDDDWKIVKDKQKLISIFKEIAKKEKDDKKSNDSTKSKNNKSRTDQKGEKKHEFKLEQLSTTDKEYLDVSNAFKATLPSQTIISIEKVRNTKLYSNFAYEKNRIERETGRGKSNIKDLFHGSPLCKTIVKNGFDPRFNVARAYGTGVYFSDLARVSHGYSGCGVHQQRCSTCPSRIMLLCRVILGVSGAGINSGSVTGPGEHSLRASNIFIIPRGEQAFPAYLITYK